MGCQQGVETVMGSDVQDGHAQFQKPFHKLALGFFKVARKDASLQTSFQANHQSPQGNRVGKGTKGTALFHSRLKR
jgi:hypothetical protein